MVGGVFRTSWFVAGKGIYSILIRIQYEPQALDNSRLTSSTRSDYAAEFVWKIYGDISEEATIGGNPPYPDTFEFSIHAARSSPLQIPRTAMCVGLPNLLSAPPGSDAR
jgi:hypothetical protein